ncbi:hypothetical protein C8A05DRAFT_38877 [Staphylotrichum tortipilum]|uniref:Transcription factor domain-containing protein n=1 Tax=Staphylotrichum tortipilum TaxID=2831512 RepID=A0AAN6MB90_9PEZI|nr:hypothetical protein C8A05DRAFT_38877 [Staphylotrichum longicolle]
MVTRFLETIRKSSGRQPGTAGVAGFVEPPSSHSQARCKREPSPATSVKFERSIDNAVVLLVFALGKICLPRRGIPDVARDSEPPHGSARNGSAASPKDGAEWLGPGRRSPSQGAEPSATNLDVIPGLDYFRLATSILGGQLAGNSLPYVYAYLLAGLYWGIQARPMESHTYVTTASKTLQQKMRPMKTLRDSGHTGTGYEENMLLFAFWTALDLECGMIAELRLPQSGILTYEEQMPYPNLCWAEERGFDAPVLESYFSRLYLRRRLNELYTQLYNPVHPLQSGMPGDSIMGSWQRYLPTAYPPHSHLVATLLWRKASPLPYCILELNFELHANKTLTPPSNDPRFDLTSIWYATRGITALVKSSWEFHGLQGQHIVTNMFGTAQRQWGNVLVLSAALTDPTLGPFVDADILKGLFSRTIAFLKTTPDPTSALHISLRILEDLERKLWDKFGGANPHEGTTDPC